MRQLRWILVVGAAAVVLVVGVVELRGRGLPDPIGYPEYDIGARVEVYESNPSRDLHVHILQPDTPGPVGAVLFFHGARGAPGQFEGQAIAVRDAGMVAILVEYTTFAEGASSADTVVQGRRVVQWVRSHASALGVDPHRIAVAGASAGGRIAVGTLEEGAAGSVRASADALLLFNPAIAPEYPPANLPAPPTVVFHGEADRQVPVETARRFCTSIGDRCRIETYSGGGHGFFNTDPEYSATLDSSLAFLLDLGWHETGRT